MIILAGCQTPAEAPPPPAPAEVAPEPKIDPKVLNQRLNEAEDAFLADHLAYPEAGSALTLYRAILADDPEVEEAKRGIERIVERYIAMSLQALERRQFARARSMLARARIIQADHPSIEPTDAQLRLIMGADRSVLKLARDALRDETPELKAELRRFAANFGRCRFTIYARNDGQGRWIYQQLSADLDGQRLRAQIKIQAPTQVERLCFAQTDN